MIIVRMNRTTVECSIAASELREIGLTPESIVNGDGRTEGFMNQLNREVGQQLDFNPENEVLMMSKNMMTDGSVRIFVVKMNNDDIQKAAERIRKAAMGILDDVAQEKIDLVKNKSGADKGEALNKLVGKVSETMSGIYMSQEDPSDNNDSSDRKAISVPVSDFSSYLAQFSSLSDCIEFINAIKKTGVEKSALYHDKDKYFLEIGLRTKEDGVTYEMRKAGLEYAESFIVNSPTEKFLEENGQCLMEFGAVERLSLMNQLIESRTSSDSKMPKTAKPKAVKSKTAKPKAVKSKTAKPTAAKPKAAKPKAAKPNTAKPKAVNPKTAKPKAVKPKAVKSKTATNKAAKDQKEHE